MQSIFVYNINIILLEIITLSQTKDYETDGNQQGLTML